MFKHDANVNVIFHGLFVFVQQKHGYIDVLIPNMGPEHVYRAGTFLAEETIHPAPVATPYFLAGVSGGDAGFDDEKIILFKGRDFKRTATPEEVYARIVVPTPREIVSLRPTIDELHAAYDEHDRVDGRKPCGVHILRYQAGDLTAVKLAGHDSTLSTNNDGRFLNLHIFSQEDSTSYDDAHYTQNAFQKALSLLPGVRDPIFITNTTRLEQHRENDKERGFAALETLSIRERASRLALAGAEWRDGTPYLPRVGEGMVEAPPQDCLPVASDNTDSSDN